MMRVAIVGQDFNLPHPMRNHVEELSMVEQHEVTTGYVDVDGTRLYYEMAGAGHPLIMLHAGIANLHFWDDQWGPFAEAYRVIRYDLRGFGRSVMPPGPYNMRDDLSRLMGALGIERAYLMGASIGGGIVVDFALEHPEKVDALIPVVSGLSGSPPPSEDEMRQFEEIERTMTAARAVGNFDLIDEIEARLWVDGPNRTPEQVDPGVRERLKQMLRENRAAENADEGKPVRLDPPARGRLGEITVPTLVVLGDADLPGVIADCNIIASEIPGARKAVMHGVAHAPNMERPEEFNRIVLDFLRDLDAAS
jgi:pimeloyl-ACP methyl ester carboxylesterase